VFVAAAFPPDGADLEHSEFFPECHGGIWRLFVPQCDNRIHTRGSLGRNITRCQSHS
jgi:hypothetical protein